MKCSVNGCPSKPSHKFPYFSFPMEKTSERYKKWASFAQNSDLHFEDMLKGKIHWICGKHFSTDMFTTPQRLKLGRHAFPTLYPPHYPKLTKPKQKKLPLSSHSSTPKLPLSSHSPTPKLQLSSHSPTPKRPLSSHSPTPKRPLSSHSPTPHISPASFSLPQEDKGTVVEIFDEASAQNKIYELMKDVDKLTEENINLKMQNVLLSVKNDLLQVEISRFQTCGEVLIKKATQNMCEDFIEFTSQIKALQTQLKKVTKEKELAEASAKKNQRGKDILTLLPGGVECILSKTVPETPVFLNTLGDSTEEKETTDSVVEDGVVEFDLTETVYDTSLFFSTLEDSSQDKMSVNPKNAEKTQLEVLSQTIINDWEVDDDDEEPEEIVPFNI